MKKIAKTLAETLLEALTAAYPQDPSTPGIVVSFLGNDRGYYVSVVRYSKLGGDGKYVAAKATQPTLDAALTQCAERWFAEYAPAETAIRALKMALKERGVTVPRKAAQKEKDRFAVFDADNVPEEDWAW